MKEVRFGGGHRILFVTGVDGNGRTRGFRRMAGGLVSFGSTGKATFLFRIGVEGSVGPFKFNARASGEEEFDVFAVRWVVPVLA